MILGTAAYMAPEQARGKVVDKRADIWAFGAVLFEMLTGQRAFPGEDVTDTLALVVRGEPGWDVLPADVPARVRQVIRACLQKDARQRLGDMQSVRLALDGVFDDAAGDTESRRPDMAAVQEQLQQQTDAAVAVVRRTLGRRAALVGAAALMTGVVAGAAVWSLTRPVPPAPPETRLEISTPATGRPGQFALSPDGRQTVFVASGDGASRLWLRSLGATTAQPLAGTEGASLPFWSPDGRSVGFFGGGALKRLDLGGGAPQTLAPVTLGRGGTWNADGVIVFGPDAAGPLLRVSATGGTVTAVTTLGPEEFGHALPFFLPDGRRFLFTSVLGVPDTRGVYLGSLDGSAPTRLAPDSSQAVYLPAGSAEARNASEGGWLLWGRARTLMAQRLDLDRQRLAGDPVTLADGMGILFGY